jgi:hypothetical protein
MKKKRKKKKQEEENEEYYTCESCYFVYEKSEECCPKCGLINEKKKRELKTVQGIAVKDERSLDDFLNMTSGAKVKEQKDCKTLEELWQYKEMKGYQDFWVKHIFQSRVLKEVEDWNKKIEYRKNINKELVEKHKEYYKNSNIEEHISFQFDVAADNFLEIITEKYGITPTSLSETDVKAAIDKAWNSFYGLKKLNMKKSYKKSY